MTREQMRLWRQTAIVGLLFALAAVGSFWGTIPLGLNAQYFSDAVTKGYVPPLFEVESTADYMLYSILVSLAFSLRFVFAAVMALMLRQILIPAQYVILQQLTLMGIMGVVSSTMLTLFVLLYALLYADDSNRATFVSMARIGLLLFTQMGDLVGISLGLGAYWGRTLPRSLAIFVIVMMCFSFILSLVGLNPETPLMLGLLPLAFALISIVAYIWMVAFSVPNANTKTG